MRSFSTAFVGVLLLVLASVAHAQQPSAPPAHISYVDGDATLYYQGGSEPAVLNMPVLEGDRIRTTSGRVEVTLSDGSAVEIDSDSEVQFLGGTRIRVLGGTVEHRPAVAESASSRYLPSDIQNYGSDFDQYGSWQFEPAYGAVWYPAVSMGWRPYYYGYWSPIPPYGWTWVGYDRWTWVTHHYGRWGYAGNRWFWVPGRTWGPAWVSWGTAPDYVGWCPLGVNGRPVAAFSIGYQSGWNAWTFMARDRFGSPGYPVHRYGVEPQRIASTTPFLIHRSAPAVVNRQNVTPAIATATPTVAVPRTGRQPNALPSTVGAVHPARPGGRVPPAAVAAPASPSASATTVERLTPSTPPGTYRTVGRDNRGNDRTARPAYVGTPAVRGPAVSGPTTNFARPTNEARPTYEARPTNEARPTYDARPTSRPAPSAPARGTSAAPGRAPAAAPSGRASQGRSEAGAVHRSR